MSQSEPYLKIGSAIYERSFATIREEADLTSFSNAEAGIVVRMIHACGMVDIAKNVVFSSNCVQQARAALNAGAPILCDSMMVTHGITRTRLPADNPVICTLRDPRVAAMAQQMETTRSAAALELWRPLLEGAVVAIGNAPTALFRLFEIIDAGEAPPAAIIGMPVGFVGAAESKQALAQRTDLAFATLHGRRGGSAITAAAINALASEREV